MFETIRSLSHRRLQQSNGRPHVAATPPPAPPGFSASDTEDLGCLVRIATPTFLFALGSSMQSAVQGCIDRLHREVGRPPRQAGHLFIDADCPAVGTDTTHFVSLNINGAGTNPHVGRELSLEHRDKVYDAMQAHLDALFEPDSVCPAEKTARECTSFVLVGSNGGTSGGILDPMIDLVHEVARRRNIREPRVHVVLVGPDILVNDLTRSISPEQAVLIPSTFAQNVWKIYQSLTPGAPEREVGRFASLRHGGTPPRVFSLTIVDQTNGVSDWASTDDMTAMLADVLFFHCFTQAGIDFLGRTCDHRGCGGHDGTPHLHGDLSP